MQCPAIYSTFLVKYLEELEIIDVVLAIALLLSSAVDLFLLFIAAVVIGVTAVATAVLLVTEALVVTAISVFVIAFATEVLSLKTVRRKSSLLFVRFLFCDVRCFLSTRDFVLNRKRDLYNSS